MHRCQAEGCPQLALENLDNSGAYNRAWRGGREVGAPHRALGSGPRRRAGSSSYRRGAIQASFRFIVPASGRGPVFLKRHLRPSVERLLALMVAEHRETRANDETHWLPLEFARGYLSMALCPGGADLPFIAAASSESRSSG